MAGRILVALWVGCVALSEAGEDAPPADALQAGTQWVGTQEGDKRRPNTPQDKTQPASLEVTQRAGEAFAAEYKVAGGLLQLEGQVRRGQIVCKVTKILRGSSWEEGTLNGTWNGTLRGNELVLVRSNTKNLTRTARLKLEAADDSPTGRSHEPVLSSNPRSWRCGGCCMADETAYAAKPVRHADNPS